MQNKLYWIWFSNLSKLDKNIKMSLLESFGNAESIYQCTDFSHISYLSFKDNALLMNKNLETAYQIIDTSEKLGIQIIPFDSPDYPPSLREIYNPPYVLYAKGTIPDWESQLFIAVVGTRTCSNYGVSVVRKFAGEFAENGIVTVSGMARGIDTEVATSAINQDSKSVAVLGCGIDVTYPPENAKLMEQIITKGLLLSEFPPGTPPLPHHFPMRNRIISGISRGILVIESRKKGGSLITANLALEQGKDVFAVPGSIFNENSEGTNQIISSGNARAITNAKEIMSEYSNIYTFKKNTPRHKNRVDTTTETVDFTGFSETEAEIIQLLLTGPLHADEIKRSVGISAADLNVTLSMLEFSGKIQHTTGNIYKLNI